MNRLDRLLGLILFLQSRRYATAAVMAEHFGLSQRTIYRDMRALGEAGVPVLAEAGVGYSLLRGYHLPPVNFTEEEASALATGAMLLGRAAVPSLAAHMDAALAKIRAVLPAARRDELLVLERGMRSVAAAPAPARQPDLALLQKALGRRRVLRLAYRTQGREEAVERFVEPLGLLYYLSRWHLIAFCRLRGELRDFRADRMEEAALTDERFAPREDFTLAGYVRQHMPAPELRARVRFGPGALDRARREWWVGVAPDSGVEPDGCAVLTLSVLDWDHLAGWLLSFGDQATVLEPGVLRQRVAERAEAALRHHSACSALSAQATPRPG